MVLPIYNVIYNPDSDSGISAVSLVGRPAIQENAIFLSAENLKFSESDHTIVGPALVPDRLLYRHSNEGEFFIKFSKDAVLDLAFDFTFSESPKIFNIEHSPMIVNASIVNSWVETDDYSECSDYGYNPSDYLGTWFLGIRVPADSWDLIKKSKVVGFSVEVSTQLELSDESIVC